MIIQGAIPTFFIETVLLRSMLSAPCTIILMLLLATILVCVLFTPPSPLTVSFEMIFILGVMIIGLMREKRRPHEI